MTNQYTSINGAGTSIVVIKMKMNTSVTMRERGNLIRYAPMIPAIAPLAPTMGTVEFGLENTCPSAAATPHTR